MNVTLLTSPEAIKAMENNAALAALTCHANTDKPYVAQEVLSRIIRLGHESVLEHINLTYSVKGLSRACLQELARHRFVSLSVESTRHTLMKTLEDNEKFISLIEQTRDLTPCEVIINFSDVLKSFDVDTGEHKIIAQYAPFTLAVIAYMAKMGKRLKDNGEKISDGTFTNDMLKYFLPEFWPTNLILTANIRELRHVIELRTAPAALKEFRVLAYSMYAAVPDECKYLLSDCVYKESNHE